MVTCIMVFCSKKNFWHLCSECTLNHMDGCIYSNSVCVLNSSFTSLCIKSFQFILFLFYMTTTIHHLFISGLFIIKFFVKKEKKVVFLYEKNFVYLFVKHRMQQTTCSMFTCLCVKISKVIARHGFRFEKNVHVLPSAS